MDVFLEKSRGGGGSFPIQKITLQILLVSKRYILEKKKRNVISKKGGRGGGSSPIQKISLQIYAYLTDFLGKKRNIISKKGRGGGGQGRLEVFQKTSIFEATVVPNGVE